MSNQQNPRSDFRALHERDEAFIIPNPWDIGSARILADFGFKALATTSSGFAHSLGLRDGNVSKAQALDHCHSIVNATSLPVSADLENGYGDTPEDVAQTINDAISIGLAGCSIEDHTGYPENPIFGFNLALERIHAAVEAKRAAPYDFMLTARCENHIWQHADIEDTIKRLQAFEKAGADVLFAPGLRGLEQITEVCSSLEKPVNVVIETLDPTIDLEQLSKAGVKRISVGSKLFLNAYNALIKSAREMMTHGSFTFKSDTADFFDMENYFRPFEKK